MTITDEIKQICAEIAEKLPQLSGGGGVKPSLAEIAGRTDLAYWYQYLMSGYYYTVDEETREEIFIAETKESVNYPQYTQDITDFSKFTQGFCDSYVYGNIVDCSLQTKKFSGTLDTSNGTKFYRMFLLCNKTEDFGNLSDTSKGTNFSYMFYGCSSLTTTPTLDLRNANSISYMLNNCSKLTNLYVKNIKANLQIGYHSSWGHLLTVDSLVNTIYECRDTGSIKTLTVGSANLSKLANVYVKLIDITDEMRAEDDLIDEKLPFEVCESTDEGAMLIANYVGLKNWKLA